MEQKQFDSNIKAIKASGVKMDKVIHETACFALEQVNKHGNVNFANQLINALGKSHRKGDLIAWFTKFGKMVFQEKEKVFKASMKKVIKWEGEEQTVDNSIIIATEVPFYDLTKDTIPNLEVDYLKSMQSLLNRLIKKSQEPGVVVKNVEYLEKVKAAIAA